jgi:SPRY domain
VVDGAIAVSADHRTLGITVPRQWGFSTARYRCALERGRWYWEVVYNGHGYSVCVGVTSDQVPMFIDEHLANMGPGGCFAGAGIFFPGYRPYRAYAEVGDVLSVLFDAERGELRYWINGIDQGPAPGLYLGHTFYPTVFLNGGCDQVTLNFGPRFQYPPPPGYQPLPGA